MKLPSPFSWAFLAVAGLLCAVALGAAAYWVAADDSPGLSQNSVAAGSPLVPLDEDGRVRTARARTAETVPAVPVRRGRAVFAAECAGCHTLAAARARGDVGPNLDVLSPSVARVRAQVTSGGGGMPAFGGALSPQEIRNVAVYVAGSARRPRPATTTRSIPVTPPPRTVTDDDDDSRGRDDDSDDDSGKGRGRGRGGDDDRDD